MENPIEVPMHVLQAECTLHWNGIHGIRHWERVHANGLRLAAITGADPKIVALFAYLHDLKRLSDGRDIDHGRRAAEYIHTIQGSLISLSAADLETLCYACEHHSRGLNKASPTVLTCWDADRLDLGRVGIPIDEIELCTSAAANPDLKKWAFQRSLAS